MVCTRINKINYVYPTIQRTDFVCTSTRMYIHSYTGIYHAWTSISRNQKNCIFARLEPMILCIQTSCLDHYATCNLIVAVFVFFLTCRLVSYVWRGPAAPPAAVQDQLRPPQPSKSDVAAHCCPQKGSMSASTWSSERLAFGSFPIFFTSSIAWNCRSARTFIRVWTAAPWLPQWRQPHYCPASAMCTGNTTWSIWVMSSHYVVREFRVIM
jgi:hypothetical protein